jgi:hypothetical protein
MGVAQAQTKGLTGFSIYTATGHQTATVKVNDLRVKNTSIRLPSQHFSTSTTFWLTGLNYTHVFDNQWALGGQVEYYPISRQVAVSVSPGYAFNDSVLGYLKLGWAYVPTTVDQGPGRQSHKTNLNAAFAGFGVKAMLYRGLFGYAELTYAQVERLNFNSWVGAIPVSGHTDTSAINAVIGLGYRF